VLVLHQLRRLLGNEVFVEAMESFGKQNAGKEVSTAQFKAHVEKAAGKKLDEFFGYWVNQDGLPILGLGNGRDSKASVVQNGKGYTVEATIRVPAPALPATVGITVEMADGERFESRLVNSTENKFVLHPNDRPKRVLVNTDVITAQNGGAFTILSFLAEPKQTLIVYGTGDEIPTNKEAAKALQQAIRQSWCNVTVPIKTDKEVKDDDLKNHHLLLIGRPDSNSVIHRSQPALPIVFGPRSFTVGQDHYAHAGSAVIAAGDNPLNLRYSMVVIAGLNAESTLRAAPLLLRNGRQAGNVLVLPHGGQARGLVVPSRELIVDLFEVEREKPKAATGGR
jgi:hypothetical protein